MRKNLLVTCALIAAACSDQSSPTGLRESRVVPVSATSKALTIAVDDALDRLLPALGADASESIRSALHTLAAAVHNPTTDPSAVREALTRTLRSLDQFGAPGRADAATLDALRLELNVDQ